MSLFPGIRTVRSNDVHGMQLCEFTYSPQASARHFGVPARANPFGAKIVAFVRAGASGR